MKNLKDFVEFYLDCFQRLECEALVTCYHVPCTLTTPEQLLVMDNKESLVQQLAEIIEQLKQAQVTGMKISNVSFSKVYEDIIVLGMSWQLMTDSGQIFSEFFACYHLVCIEGCYRIISVSSQHPENAVTFSTELTIGKEH